jgi:cell division protein FtsB
MNILDFTLGAITLAIGLIIKPYVDVVVMRLKRLFTAKKHTIEQHNLEVIVERVNELEEQINNIAEAKYVRERNRKSNIRREVRDYLAELRSDK